MLSRTNKPAFQPNVEATKRLEQIESVTKLMDSRFKIPGTNFRFGIDPLLGLIPFAGDIASLGLQGLLLTSMMKYGASRKVVILMILNILLDFAIGSIPVLGNIFDFFFKGSQRNLNLLKRHYGEGKHMGSGNGVLIIVLIVAVAIVGLVGYLSYLLLAYLVEAIRGL